jgi:DNA-binding CsgD family transcriptional regulator
VSTMARVMVEFSSFVSSKPSMDEVAQQLVLSTLSKFQPRSAVLYSFHANGFVTLNGSFGLSPFPANIQEAQSIWTQTPAIDAIRQDQQLSVDSIEEMQARYPHLVDDSLFEAPLSVWPLKLGSVRMGALQVRFLAPQKSDEFLAKLRGVSTILSLYLGFRNQEHAAVKVPKHRDHEWNGSRVSGMEKDIRNFPQGEMTNRQLKILGFLVEGLTNPQIAQRIGFSESTVRQETMSVYRHLGVRDRRAAAEVAVERKLLRTEPQPGLRAGLPT